METTARGAKKLREDKTDPASAYREAINANADLVGASAWTAIVFSEKTEDSTIVAASKVAVRAEGPFLARLKGTVQVQAGQSVANGDTILTVPVGFRPPVAVLLASPTIEVLPTGIVKWTGATQVAGAHIVLGDAAFHLT